ncbi:MAG TPA: DUF3077 domain-containing protein [Pseudomonas xinjiangensis]|uniref:DUF3077 domain-containing protein n=2 Tax=root TaxID=1 RepID=A0A7V1BLY5_9GAMM|nr:DUF3077 domain-containing protein [Halopseudomonas xinjiangensis]HEC48153.1 DUF3077 domain-containing protein [Halopseudomonas xinjiangensis]
MNAIVQGLAPTSIKTDEGTAFCNTGWVEKQQRLFTVNVGVDITDALQTASDMLDTALTPVNAAGMGEPLVDNNAWLVHHTLESAKAVVDAVHQALKERGINA